MPETTCCNRSSSNKDLNNNETKEKVFKKARRKIRTLFYWQTSGLVLSLSALIAVQLLQTSINIEGRVGSISVTAGFVTSIFVGLFICPTLLNTLGPTASLILSEICYLIYCLCNFYPELYVLLPGAMFSGIGRALFVPSYSMLIITLTMHCAKYNSYKEEEHYFNQLQSWYYCLNELVQIIGNGLSYAVLYSTYTSTDNIENTYQNNLTVTNYTPTANSSLYQYCGANDCQDDSIIQQSLHQYVPPTKSSIYIFLSATVLLALSGISIHCFIFPGVGPFSHKLSKLVDKIQRKLSLNEGEIMRDCLIPNGEFEKTYAKSDTNGHGVNRYDEFCETLYEGGDCKLIQSNHVSGKDFKQNETHRYWRTLKTTLMFMINPRAMLLGIASIHSGMLVGFTFADLTRAYASCVAGVQMTGAFAASFGIAGMISSLMYGKILPIFGRHVIYVVISVLEVAVCLLCYYWIPDRDTLYTVFAIFFGSGFVNGMLRQNLIASFTIHFPKKKSLGLTAFNVAYTGGIGIQYGLSTFMCVDVKIYTQIGVAVTGLICYIIADFLSRSKDCRESTIPLDSRKVSSDSSVMM